MKSILMVAALLAGLAVPALAEEATTPPLPQAQAAVTPAPEAAVPAALPQSPAVEVVPMSTSETLDDTATARSDGGCHHAKTTVYLTN